jgi:hypothetical protein
MREAVVRHRGLQSTSALQRRIIAAMEAGERDYRVRIAGVDPDRSGLLDPALVALVN